jgi:hypothetical protein
MEHYHGTFDIGQVHCIELKNTTLVFLNDLYIGSSNLLHIPLVFSWETILEIKNFEEDLYQFVLSSPAEL